MSNVDIKDYELEVTIVGLEAPIPYDDTLIDRIVTNYRAVSAVVPISEVEFTRDGDDWHDFKITFADGREWTQRIEILDTLPARLNWTVTDFFTTVEIALPNRDLRENLVKLFHDFRPASLKISPVVL